MTRQRNVFGLFAGSVIKSVPTAKSPPLNVEYHGPQSEKFWLPNRARGTHIPCEGEGFRCRYRRVTGRAALCELEWGGGNRQGAIAFCWGAAVAGRQCAPAAPIGRFCMAAHPLDHCMFQLCALLPFIEWASVRRFAEAFQPCAGKMNRPC